MNHAIDVGTELPTVTQTADLATSVRYAGASGDFNPLHFDEEVARVISPTEGVITHGMFSMGLVSRALTDFAGGPEHVRELSVRFSRPWPLGTTSTFGGRVTAVEDGHATVVLWGENEDGTRVLRGKARIAVQPRTS